MPLPGVADIPVDAPIGGWNTRDAIDNIPETDAIILDNWLPGLGDISARGGSQQYFNSDDIPGHTPGPVLTLMTFDGQNGYHLLGADGGAIYRVVTPAPAADLGTGFGSNVWDWTNFDEKLIAVNGVDSPQSYDGSTLSALAPALSPVIVPVGCHAYKNRMYYWEAGSQDVYYTALNAAGGTVTAFPLSRLGTFGGTLMEMHTWTRDGGDGPDDYAVFIMSSGETIVYGGTSPADPSWLLVGIYNIGRPLGPRCATKFGGDLYIMTALDIVSLGEIVAGPEAAVRRSKISGAMEGVVGANQNSYSWAAMAHPQKKLMVFNIPIVDGSEYHQYAMNGITGAWGRMRGWKAHCWANFFQNLFFGTDDGIVNLAFSDLATDNGAPINLEVQTAWLALGSPGNKQCNAVKPNYRSSAAVPFNAVVAVDFADFPSLDWPIPTAPNSTPWGSPWGSPWSGQMRTDAEWEISNGYGRRLSLLKKNSTLAPLRWISTIFHAVAGEAL